MSRFETHRAYLEVQDDIIVMSGATLSDDGETVAEAVIIAAESRDEAEAFSKVILLQLLAFLKVS